MTEKNTKTPSRGIGACARLLAVIALAALVQLPLCSWNGRAAGPASPPPGEKAQPSAPGDAPKTGLPRLIDLGAGKCIPCKMMAPILEDLKKTYAGRLDVQVIDVGENPDAVKKYGISIIPTQIFYDATERELFRHQGFLSKEDILAKWKELGVGLGGSSAEEPVFSRLEPAATDTRPRESICYMCDGDINPKTLVVVKSEKGDVRLCGPHCYFILYSCLTEDKTDFEKKVFVADWNTGKPLAAAEAFYLYGLDEKTSRPWIRAFADRDSALKERAAGGSVIGWQALQTKELSHRCGFCDRALYPEDAALVLVGGVQTWGCCSHCALGVAARTGKDIEVHQPDRLTGEMIVVKTLDGKVASIEPPMAVAWFGMRKKPDGAFVSAGCFHQGFFVNADNLKRWAERNPTETGKLISIAQALEDKMKLSTEQIQKACKIGECAPK